MKTSVVRRCSFADCPRPARGRDGWCRGHQLQLHRAGGDEAALRALVAGHGRIEDAVLTRLRIKRETAEALAVIGARLGASAERSVKAGARHVLERHAKMRRARVPDSRKAHSELF